MVRQVFVMTALLLFSGNTYAQERGTALGGVRFGADAGTVAAAMSELRLTRSSLLDRAGAFPQDQSFEGLIDGRNVVVITMYDGSGALEKMVVSFITADADCLRFYRDFKVALTREFGETHADVERWSTPYDRGRHLGREEEAIRSGAALIGATWNRDDGGATAGTSLSIGDNLTVTLTYESSKWPTELERRRKVLKASTSPGLR